jgi:hypothetical protein
MEMGSVLTGESIRQGWMSLMLASASVAGGVAVSNERAVFVPISGVEQMISDTARAFAAIAAPSSPEIDTLYFPKAVAGLGRHSGLRRRATPTGDTIQPSAFDRPDPFGDMSDQSVFGSQAQDQIMASAQASGESLGSGAPMRLASLGNVGPGFYTGVDNPPGDGGGSSGTDPSDPTTPIDPTTPVPEPSAWMLMIGGFGLVGGLQRLLRHARRVSLAFG